MAPSRNGPLAETKPEQAVAFYARPEGTFYAKEGTPQHVMKWREQIDHRLEVLSEVLSTGVNTKAIAKAARRLKVRPEVVRYWIKEPQVIKDAARYATAQALSSQAELAKENVIAFQNLAKIAGVLDSGGPKIQVNTAVDARTVGNTESDRRFFQQYQNRVEAAQVEATDPS